MHDSDLDTHKCDIAEIPVKGKIKKPMTTIDDVIE